MIQDREIEAKAAQLFVPPTDVEKDYVHGWVLHAIANRPILNRLLILKGGNAIRKAYLRNGRFSKDLDFSAIEKIDKNVLETELREICRHVTAQTGVQFLDQQTSVREKDLSFTDTNPLEARIYFKGFYNEENITLKTQLDITELDRILLPVQNRTLLHDYSDGSICTAQVRCHKLEEVLASKLLTLLHRRKAGDLFDLSYSVLVSGDYPVSRAEVIQTFLRKTIFPSANDAKTQLLAVPVAEYEPLWAKLVAPAQSIFDFKRIGEGFSGLIESLFSLVPQNWAASQGGNVDLPRVHVPGNIKRGATSPYFSPANRRVIIEAGRTATMIELTYSGVRRLVEPYKLEFRIRQKDGRGLEYFWGYDTTGGVKSGPSIKQFICDQIESVRPTGRRFDPQWAIEL